METWKLNLEETKKHYRDWWNQRGIVLNMWEHFQQGVEPHADVPAPPPYRDLEQRWFDPEWRAQQLDWYVAHSSLKADILPVANTQLGPGSLAAILGGQLEGGEDTIWIHPAVDFNDDIRFDPEHPNWKLHKALLTACKRKAQGHYYVGMPDLMEGLDVLAALVGTDRVLLDTVTHPERVLVQLQQINDIYFQVFDELYDIIREGDEMAFCYFSLWAPGKMTKLQSDISTMISTADFRRFVQPFIREQCQRIPYTLYHLDGVGAIRHLDALLEIPELRAIQWTPGVGEPQGGSAKWYELYRRILAGGKSVMASWVTLDELRPLLDAIGTEGVHLEMDFHNEREVEEAMRIVEEYRRNGGGTTVSDGADKIDNSRILVLDGGMGTMLQRYHLEECDYRGERFATHPVELKGCNDVLSLTNPMVVRVVHRKYLEAGADIIETNTFNAQRISMADYGLADYCREMNIEAVKNARMCAEEYSTPQRRRLVAGSIGPTSRTTSPDTGDDLLDEEELRAAYREQIEALTEGGVDLLLIETIFDTRNARIALDECRSCSPRTPVMLSFSVATPDGRNMMGQDIVAFLRTLRGERLFSVGINCVTDVRAMTPLVRRLGQLGWRVSIYPNAGLPDEKGDYRKTPQQLVADLWPLLEHHRLNIVGGCCGTNDEHIRMISRAIQPVEGVYLSPLEPGNGGSEAVSEGDDGAANIARSMSEPDASNDIQHGHDDDTRPPLFRAILTGDGDAAEHAVKEALSMGEDAHELIDDQMIAAMSEMGRRFQSGEAFVPQLLMSGRAMKRALALLRPLMQDGEQRRAGKVVIGTVKGDLHDIGKNLVSAMLEGCGFEVVDIGIDVSADRFVDAVRAHRPDILCLSALLTTTMGYMKQVIDALSDAGLRQTVKIMVGGAPVSRRFAEEIGADAYSEHANAAVAVAKQLMNM